MGLLTVYHAASSLPAVALCLLPAGATSLVKLQAPQADELGFARALAVQEIGGTKCLVLQQDSKMGQISTVVLRGSTDQVGVCVGGRPWWCMCCGCAVASFLPGREEACLPAASCSCIRVFCVPPASIHLSATAAVLALRARSSLTTATATTPARLPCPPACLAADAGRH